MASIQLPLTLAPKHRNQQLFSDYYLTMLLPDRADWKMLLEDARPIRQQIRALFDAYTPSAVEAQTEDGLIKPILSLLGHTFEIQAAFKTPDGTKKPDYVFYRDAAALTTNKNRTLDEAAFVEEVRKRRPKAAASSRRPRSVRFVTATPSRPRRCRRARPRP